MTHFKFEIPDELHTLFKMISIKKKIDMKDILLELIKDYVTKNKKSLMIREQVKKASIFRKPRE